MLGEPDGCCRGRGAEREREREQAGGETSGQGRTPERGGELVAAMTGPRSLASKDPPSDRNA
jgi:hypothetical protein